MTTRTAPTTAAGFLAEALATRSRSVVDDLAATGHHETTSPYVPGHVLTVTLVQEPDHDTDLSDFDCYGKIEWVHPYAYGPAHRPPFMDGNAEKVHCSQHGVFWWQPPESGPPRTDLDAFRQLRDMVSDLAVFGFHVVVLTATHETPDGYTRTWSTALGGVEPFVDKAHLADLASDLLSDLTTDMED